MRQRRIGLACVAVGLALAGSAAADPPRLHGTAAGARAIGGHQQRELGWGATGLAAAELPLVPQLGAQLELGALWLGERAEPEDPRFAAQGDASAAHAAVGVRARPAATAGTPARFGPAGFWLAAAVGPVRTGGLTRLMADAQVGYDVFLREGRFGIGPAIGLVHVFQPDDELRPADANVLFAEHPLSSRAARGGGALRRRRALKAPLTAGSVGHAQRLPRSRLALLRR